MITAVLILLIWTVVDQGAPDCVTAVGEYQGVTGVSSFGKVWWGMSECDTDGV